MAWEVYRKGLTQEPFDVWLNKNLPSVVRRDDGFEWISVTKESYLQRQLMEKADLVGLLNSWEQHLLNNGPVNYEVIKKFALKYHILCGKWLFFTDQGGKVDHLWSLIASSIIKDDIPIHSAKVSAHDDDESSHVICIYNTDFTNTDEVLDAEEAIRRVGIKCRLQYKPDIYTYLFIYGGNPWGLKPYIMTSQYSLQTHSSVIKKEV